MTILKNMNLPLVKKKENLYNMNIQSGHLQKKTFNLINNNFKIETDYHITSHALHIPMLYNVFFRSLLVGTRVFPLQI